MVAMGIVPFKDKSPWQNRESNPGPHNQWSETLTTRQRGWSEQLELDRGILFKPFNIKFHTNPSSGGRVVPWV
jgi:hypothetical protein